MAVYLNANATKAASVNRSQSSKFTPRRQYPLVYLTADYDCYDQKNSDLCRHLANRLVKERHANPVEFDWLVDAFRDELAAIMSKFVPGGSASAHTFASKRLPLRLNNVWNKYKAMCRHNAGGRAVPIEAPKGGDCDDTTETNEFIRAMMRIEEERGRTADHRRLLERIDEIVAIMPPAMKRPCQLIMAGNSMTRTAQMCGISHQAFTETRLPRIREFFIVHGLFEDMEVGNER